VPALTTAPFLTRRRLTDSDFEDEYNQVWNLVDDNFLYRDRLLNWEEWHHKYDGKLHNLKTPRKSIKRDACS